MCNLFAAAICLGTAAIAEPVTIAALGDSLTQGYGLPVDQGFVPQLEDWLLAQGHDVILVNAGVSGDTTAGGLARIGWTLSPDVDALIVALGGNDMLRGIDPGHSRENLAGILDVARMQDIPVLLVGLPAATNFGADYKAAFDAMYPALSADYGTALFPDFFTGLRGGDEAQARIDFMQPDGIHPNAAGVALIVAAIGPAVADLVAAAQ